MVEFKSIDPPSPHETRNHTWYYAWVVCTIDAAAGEPRFAITMEGHDEELGELLEEHTVPVHDSDSFYGRHFAAVSIVSNVIIICRVTDDEGTYIVNQSVTLKGRIQY